MGSYSYIYLSNSPSVEDDDAINEEAGGAVEEQGIEGDQEYEPVFLRGFEAKYYIPLFWLMLFEAEHCKSYLDEIDEEEEIDEDDEIVTEAYIPYLSAPLQRALDNASRRRHLLEKLITSEQLALFDYWTAKLAEESALYIEVDLEDLVRMSSPEDYETFKNEITSILAYLEEATPESLLSSQELLNIAALNCQDSAVTPYMLCGYSFDLGWPHEDVESSLRAKLDRTDAESNDQEQEELRTPHPPKSDSHAQKEEEHPQGLLKRLWHFLLGR